VSAFSEKLGGPSRAVSRWGSTLLSAALWLVGAAFAFAIRFIVPSDSMPGSFDWFTLTGLACAIYGGALARRALRERARRARSEGWRSELDWDNVDDKTGPSSWFGPGTAIRGICVAMWLFDGGVSPVGIMVTVTGIWAAIEIVLAWRVLRSRLSGVSGRLSFVSPPARPGGALCAVFLSKKRLSNVKLTLRNVLERPAGAGSWTMAPERWQEDTLPLEGTDEGAGPDGLWRLALRAEIPAGALVNELGADPPRYWEIEIRARDERGGPYLAQFPVPVYYSS
jgi:hypothetical protein